MNEYQYPAISVIEPVGWAVQKTKEILFQPFDLKKWFILGFCAWLATLGEGGGGNFNFGGPSEGRGGDLEGFKQAVVENLPWLIPVVIVVVLFVILISLVVTWLQSRGKFMFLYCVALNRAEVARPWTFYAEQGNSLFFFRLVFGVISVLCILPMIGLCIFSVVVIGRAGASSGAVAGIVFSVLALIGMAICFTLIGKFTTDFVVPIMYLKQCRVLDAWREFMGVLSACKGKFAVYILFQIVLSLVIGSLVIVLVLATCCTAACFLMIPYIGTVLLLPLLVFSRSYSLLYLAQYGPAYNVFYAASAPVVEAAADAQSEPIQQPPGEESQNPQDINPDMPAW